MPVILAAWAAVSTWLKGLKLGAAALLYAGLVLTGVAGAEVYEHTLRLRILFVTLEGLGPRYADLKAKDAAALRAAVAHVKAVTAAQVAATKAAGAAETIAQTKISTAYHTLKQEVATYVPPYADADCPIPNGAVRVFDAAAGGVPSLPDAAAQSDAAPSGVALSTVIATTVDNDAVATANAEQLSALQAWIRAQDAAWNVQPAGKGGATGSAP
jgi:hypothetical protein